MSMMFFTQSEDCSSPRVTHIMHNVFVTARPASSVGISPMRWSNLAARCGASYDLRNGLRI